MTHLLPTGKCRTEKYGRILSKVSCLKSLADGRNDNQNLRREAGRSAPELRRHIARRQTTARYTSMRNDYSRTAEVMAALRDRQQNPEWDYVREGPEWWGRRVGRAEELWQA